MQVGRSTYLVERDVEAATEQSRVYQGVSISADRRHQLPIIQISRITSGTIGVTVDDVKRENNEWTKRGLA